MENSTEQDSTDLSNQFADEPEQMTHDPVQPVRFTESASSKQNPIYLYALIGLLILIVIGMFFLRQMDPITSNIANQIPLSPTEVPAYPTATVSLETPSSERSGWKKYTNNLQGYSIEYPASYIVAPYSREYENLFLVSSQAVLDRTSQVPTADELELTVYSDRLLTSPPVTHTSLRDFVYKEDHESGLKVENVSWVKINGIEVAKEKMSDTDRYYWLHEGYLYYIDVQPNNTKLKNEVDQILSTFKFTSNDKSSSVPSGFNHDYKNTTYNYQVSLPSTWKAYNVDSGRQTGAALPNSLIVDISDSTQTSRPYPNGVVTIQGLQSEPSYTSTWRSAGKLMKSNGVEVRIFENENGEDGFTTAYLFTAPAGYPEKYIEVLFRASKEDSIWKIFQDTMDSFEFTKS